MSGPAAPGRARALATAGWGRATREGALAFVLVLVLAVAVAVGAVAAGALGLGLADLPRVVGAYVALAHRVPLRISIFGSGLWLLRALGAPPGTRGLELRLAVAPLALTAVAGWSLWRAGRRTGEAAGGPPRIRALHGAKVGPAYAALVLLATLPVRVSLVPAGLDLRAELSVPVWPALLLPLAFAAAVGAVGGWWSGAPAGTLRAAVLGGSTMAAAGLGLALVGLVLAGVVHPDGPEALLTPTTGRYLRAVLARPALGAAAIAHHVAVLPNEAAWTLVPAMGGCTGPHPGDPFLCPTRFPRSVRLPVWLRPPGAGAGPPTRFGTAPLPYLAFLLVPVAATVIGGVWAGRAEPGRALVAGLLAGAVFAALVVALAWASSISVSAAVRTTASAMPVRAVRIGPQIGGAAALALAWGLGGGAVGGALSGGRGALRPGSPPGR